MIYLKALYGAVAAGAIKRIEIYPAKVKTILDQMESKSLDKNLKDMRSVLTA